MHCLSKWKLIFLTILFIVRIKSKRKTLKLSKTKIKKKSRTRRMITNRKITKTMIIQMKRRTIWTMMIMKLKTRQRN